MNNLGWKKFEWGNLKFQDYETEEDNGARHYLIDGNRYPSMTTMLSVLNDGGIDDWRKRVGEEEADKIVRDAINRGNSLHNLSELYLMNQLEPKDVKGHGKVLFNRNRRYLNELQLVLAIEVVLYSHTRKYAGRADCIAIHDGDLCIVDHKNSRNAIDLSKGYAKKKIFSYTLQATGYGLAFQDMFPHLPKPTHGMLIVGNHNTMSSSKFKFELAPLEKEFDKILTAYYNHTKAETSMYYKL